MTDLYEELIERAFDLNESETYEPKEVEKITTKIWNFFNCLEESSKVDAARNITILIYLYDNYSEVKARGVPYKGKSSASKIDFDFKNLPPLLARLVFLYVSDFMSNNTQ